MLCVLIHVLMNILMEFWISELAELMNSFRFVGKTIFLSKLTIGADLHQVLPKTLDM